MKAFEFIYDIIPDSQELFAEEGKIMFEELKDEENLKSGNSPDFPVPDSPNITMRYLRLNNFIRELKNDFNKIIQMRKIGRHANLIFPHLII